MSNLQRIELLWEYLTDHESFSDMAFILPEEIDDGTSYLDMEDETIYTDFHGVRCKITIVEVG